MIAALVQLKDALESFDDGRIDDAFRATEDAYRTLVRAINVDAPSRFDLMHVDERSADAAYSIWDETHANDDVGPADPWEFDTDKGIDFFSLDEIDPLPAEDPSAKSDSYRRSEAALNTLFAVYNIEPGEENLELLSAAVHEGGTESIGLALDFIRTLSPETFAAAAADMGITVEQANWLVDQVS